jgi:hypothetical protein
MGDQPPEEWEETAKAPVAPPPPPATLTVAKDVERDSFVETFHVREKGRRYEVAANAVANRAMMQVNVAKLRTLAERVIQPYLDNPAMPIGPKEFKLIADGFDLIENMSAAAYSDSKKGGTLANSLEKLVYAATRGAASGAMEKANSHSPEARMKRMQALVAKAKPVGPTKDAEIVE